MALRILKELQLGLLNQMLEKGLINNDFEHLMISKREENHEFALQAIKEYCAEVEALLSQMKNDIEIPDVEFPHLVALCDLVKEKSTRIGTIRVISTCNLVIRVCDQRNKKKFSQALGLLKHDFSTTQSQLEAYARMERRIIMVQIDRAGGSGKMTNESQMMDVTMSVGETNIDTSSCTNAPPTMAPAEKPEKFSGIDFKRWNYILSGLQDDLYNVYSGTKTSKELKFVVSQVQELQVIIHDLLAEGLIVNDAFQVAAIVEKLPPLWKGFKNYLKHKRKEMIVEDLIFRLRIEEDNKAVERRSKRNSTINGTHIVEDDQNHFKKRKKAEQGSNQPKKSSRENASTVVRLATKCNLTGNPREWWMDSGATRYLCANKELFSSFAPAQVEEMIYMDNSATAKTAFLNGDLKEEIYMEQPENFVVPGKENKIKFDMKDLGVADVILEIRIYRSPQGLALSKSQYIEKVLDKFKDMEFGIAKTQLDVNFTLRKNEGGGAVSWKSSKQTCIARSTMESEFIALDKASEEAEWLRNFLEDIPYCPKPVAPVCIHCDSQAAIGRVGSMMYNGKSRHIRRRHNTVRELFSSGIITIDYVKLKNNVSDPLTKGLSREGVERTSKGMSLRPRTSQHGVSLNQPFDEEVGVDAHDMDYVEAQKNYAIEEENEIDVVDLDEDDENIEINTNNDFDDEEHEQLDLYTTMSDANIYIDKFYNHYADLLDLAVPTNITPTVAPHYPEETSSSKRPAHSYFPDYVYDLNVWNSFEEETYTAASREELMYYLRTPIEDRRRQINALDW
ncbi:putative transcription factor MYB21-like [Capsicum annuum]|nr:putative transcription factor MYB21-like [Capsicum annuum]